MSEKIILGLHGFSSHNHFQMHDAGICLMMDGKVVAAINEERLTRNKRDGNFPVESFSAGMKMAGLSASDITDVAFVDKRTPWQTMYVAGYALSSFLRARVNPSKYLLFWAAKMFNYRRYPPRDTCPESVKFYEHHLCHAASAYYLGPWSEATIISLDGMGDFSIGGMTAYGKNGKINIMRRSNGYFSPGHFYMILTEYLGFIPGLHEGKVTGLAAYGNPRSAYHTMETVIGYRKGELDFIAPLVAEEFFNIIRSSPLERTRQWYAQQDWSDTEMQHKIMSNQHTGLQKFKKLWSSFSPEDIAAAGQARFEDIICEYVRDAVALTGCPYVVAAGGCFANVRLNQKILTMPEIKNIYIYPNMNDGGLSTGAAMLHYHSKARKRKYTPTLPAHVYFGPSYSDTEIKTALLESKLTFEKPGSLAYAVAQYLADGKIIGLFQGGMEYGPRALGNRSLLAAPTDQGMPARLNSRLRRTDFMPFAPVILEEFAHDWLKDWSKDHIASCFMTITYDINPDKRHLVPAIVHVDGTARPQVLRHETNPVLHQIITRYYYLTNIPLLINTSFNMHEEPIVCSPTDAISSFKRGAGDVLAIGPYIAI